MLFVGAVAVNAFAQGALRRFPQWPWIEHPTFGKRTLIAARRTPNLPFGKRTLYH